MRSVTLSIPDMKCGGCANAVQSALSNVGGVENADVSFEGKTAIVTIAEDIAIGALLDAIGAAGYTPTVVE